jgi:hypothetical protein
MGWGGEPKGAGRGSPRFDFTHYKRPPKRAGHSPTPAEPSERILRKRQRSEAMEDNLWHLMHRAETEMLQIWAAYSLWKMYNGRPGKMTVNSDQDWDDPSHFSDEELAAELQRLGE